MLLGREDGNDDGFLLGNMLGKDEVYPLRKDDTSMLGLFDGEKVGCALGVLLDREDGSDDGFLLGTRLVEKTEEHLVQTILSLGSDDSIDDGGILWPRAP